jgi:hypothetical protein
LETNFPTGRKEGRTEQLRVVGLFIYWFLTPFSFMNAIIFAMLALD